MREMTSAPGYLGIETERTSSVMRIRLWGELDMLTAPLLAEVLERDRVSGRRHLVVDMTELQFMDRAGLAALLEGAGQSGRQRPVLSITGCTPNVRRVLELTGHEDLINDSPLTGLSSTPGSA
jgi:anti-sigma B factor antagonist